jgi:hypothetical protein
MLPKHRCSDDLNGLELGPSRCYVPARDGVAVFAGYGLALLLQYEKGLLGQFLSNTA